MERFEKMKAERGFTNIHLQDIADYVHVHKGDFVIERMPGQIATQKIYDNTAIEAAQRLAASLYGGLTNSESRWFNIGIKGKKHYKNLSLAGKQWLDNATLITMNVFNSSWSGFASHNHEYLLSMVTLGTSAMFVEDALDKGIKFATVHLSEVYVAENKYGEIDTVARMFNFSARQMIQKFGEENVHKNVLKASEKDPDQKFKILHFVQPASESNYDIGKHFKFVSCYVDTSNIHLIDCNGFYEMPYIVARFDKRVGEVYGRSPAWNCLPAIKMINQMSKELLIASEYKSRPPLLVSDDGVIVNIKATPGSIIAGGLGPDGQERIRPLMLGADIQDGIEIITRQEQLIKESFFVDQLYFKEGTPVTATEAVQRSEEKLRMVTPHVSRIEAEYLNPLIERVFSILLRSGAFGTPPEELKGKDIEVEYLSPLSKLQKMSDISALQRVLQVVAPLMQMDPTVMDGLNIADNVDYIGEAAGLPARFLRSPEQIKQIKAQRAQQQQQQQQMQQAQQMNEINKPLQ